MFVKTVILLIGLHLAAVIKRRKVLWNIVKNFIDCVNSQHVNESDKNQMPAYAEHIKACHYYDSIVVVEKEHRGTSVVTEFGQ